VSERKEKVSKIKTHKNQTEANTQTNIFEPFLRLRLYCRSSLREFPGVIPILCFRRYATNNKPSGKYNQIKIIILYYQTIYKSMYSEQYTLDR